MSPRSFRTRRGEGAVRSIRHTVPEQGPEDAENERIRTRTAQKEKGCRHVPDTGDPSFFNSRARKHGHGRARCAACEKLCGRVRQHGTGDVGRQSGPGAENGTGGSEDRRYHRICKSAQRRRKRNAPRHSERRETPTNRRIRSLSHTTGWSDGSSGIRRKPERPSCACSPGTGKLRPSRCWLLVLRSLRLDCAQKR